MGLISLKKRDLEAAASYFFRTTIVEPSHYNAWGNLGVVRSMLGETDLAIDAYNRSLQINPENPDALNNRSLVLEGIGRYDEALAGFDACLVLRPNDLYALNNRGLVLGALNRIEEAIESYSKAIEIGPNYAQARHNLSMMQLVSGDFENGWANHEWRWANDAFTSPRRNFTAPIWNGPTNLEGKTLLIHAEQGLGDTINFCRYVSWVLNAIGNTGKLVFEVQRPLVKIMQDYLAGITIVAQGDTLPEFDYHCPLLTLPFLFKTRIDTIPAERRYLSADRKHLEKWKLKLGDINKPVVGLVWSGSTTHKNDRLRSIPLEKILPRLQNGVQYVSLQKDLRPGDIEILREHREIMHFGNDLESFSDTAAICMFLDHVISVDTSAAHLAAALGKPVSLLLPFSPDWRWLMERTDTPWYPTMTLYRQSKLGDWDSVLEQIPFNGIKNE